LSAADYRLQPNATDLQQPHLEDEIYFVVAGRARFTSSGKTVDVGPGTVLLVLAGEAHRFHDITELLEVLVVFGPPESSGSA
jgi:mannose-6-phosphate isomerase-like protein (cupin superfamily)